MLVPPLVILHSSACVPLTDAAWRAGTETQGLGNLHGQVKQRSHDISRGERGEIPHQRHLQRSEKRFQILFSHLSQQSPGGVLSSK